MSHRLNIYGLLNVNKGNKKTEKFVYSARFIFDL